MVERLVTVMVPALARKERAEQRRPKKKNRTVFMVAWA
jgi:hypothetical protein